MTTVAGHAYDLSTVLLARGDALLEVRLGLATTYRWVALAADGRPARTVLDRLGGLGPSQRAALLADAREYLDRPDGARGGPARRQPAPQHRGGAGAARRQARRGAALRGRHDA